MKKLLDIFLLTENLQQADKVYFKTGLLSNKVREIMVDEITNGDALTKMMCDLYYARLQEDVNDIVGNRNDDFSDGNRWKEMKNLYDELKDYNNNVFPVKDYNVKEIRSILSFIRGLKQRRTILDQFEMLPSVAKRNMKVDIRQVRDGHEMNHYRDQLEYFMGFYSMLNNRKEELRQTIINKMFKSNTNLGELLNFVEEKENLIGGANLTKDVIKNIIDEHHIDVVHNNGNYLVVEVYDIEAIKALGCNSVWCFTYDRKNGGANYQDWGAYSTNDSVYVFIDFSLPSDDREFMHVLVSPLDFFPENPEEDNEQKMFYMDNNDVYNPLGLVDEFMGLDRGRKLLNFDMDPQPKPKQPKPKDPNQMELKFENKLTKIFESLLLESVELKIMKNLEKSPYMGGTYGQDVEPHGTYVTEKDFDGELTGNYAVGTAFLQKPLYINVNDDTLIKYKNDLSNKYKAKGKALTKKLMNLGYDAIICVLPKGYTGEIVLFPNAKFMLHKV